jgi:predicted metal-dependent phosphoesterase TrpH
MEVLAACHIHSVWSYDGSWTLEALSERFQSRGYRILMMTEHDRGFSAQRFSEFREACGKASSNKILVVPGIEYSDAANRVHVLVWGPVPFLGESLPTGEMLERVRAAGGLAVLAHPSRREAWRTFEPAWAERLLGIEAWNRKYDGWAPSQTAPDLLKTTGAIPFVGLDFHTKRQSFPLGMMLDLQADVSEGAVLEALRTRRCQAQAFGSPLSRGMFRKVFRVLNMAEHGRQRAASVIRRARGKKR